jgi:putative FmdB family regulatory protein
VPIYEYLCESCGKVNEVFQKLNEKPPSRCDECGSRKLAKLVSRSAFQLKGGGWYSDLYASKKPAAPATEAGADKAATPTATPEGGAKKEPASPAAAKAEPKGKEDAATPKAKAPPRSPAARGKGASGD